MKVLKEGQVPSEKIHRGTCSSCKCMVEFTQGEAHEVQQQYDPREIGSGRNYWQVNCPTKGCGYKINSFAPVMV